MACDLKCKEYIREELSRAKTERLSGSIYEKSKAWETYTAGQDAATRLADLQLKAAVYPTKKKR